MKGALSGIRGLVNIFGAEFTFLWVIGAAIIAGVLALGIAGISLALGNKNFWDNFKGSFVVVGFIEFLLLMLSSC